MSLASRLIAARNAKKISDARLGEMVGVTQQAINAIETGKTLQPRKIVEIALALDVTPNFLMYGNDEANQDRGKYHADEKYAYIPRFQISAHAGSGRFPDHEEINGTHAYRRSWLTKHKLFAEHLVVIEVDGDSMQPTICDGDLILINTAACIIKSGNVYAFKTQDGVRIKRLHKQMDGRLLITSDSSNKIEFPDEYLTELALPDISGAVVHRSGGV